MVRRKRITKATWDRYKSIVNDFVDEDAGKQKLTWLRRIRQPLPYGEDTGYKYNAVILEGLLQYNFIRTWPSLKETVSGELDGINIVLYVTKRTLEEKGYMTADGYWNFDWVQDKFLINGRVYSPAGDTQVAQASDEPLLFFVVLKRETPEDTEEIKKYVENIDKYIRLQQNVVTLAEYNRFEETNKVFTNTEFRVKPKD